MSYLDVVAAIRKKTAEKIRSKERFLGDGKATDWAHYRSVVGEISAHKATLAMVKDTLRDHTEIDEDDEFE